MNTTNSLTHESCLRSFKSIMDSKYNISPIAEKANRNLSAKKSNTVNRNQRLHYFTLGHRFKALDYETLFLPVLNETDKKKEAKRFASLLRLSDEQIATLETLVDTFRNINSHFVHDFDKLRIDLISEATKQLITEAFECAVLVTYCKEMSIPIPDSTSYPALQKDIVFYLFRQFYPKNMEKGTEQEVEERMKAWKKEFTSLSITQAIEQLLFVTLDADMDWKLQYSNSDSEANLQTDHTAFNIKAGQYLSFNACLFIASLFLYRSEAKMLISKIKGFKLNKLEKHRSKRDIITFFAKKFGSRDASNEEMHLVKFHDMIGYLCRYPVAWNADLELKSSHEQMTNKLKAQIADRELRRIFSYQLSDDSYSYIQSEQHEAFISFAKLELFSSELCAEVLAQLKTKLTFSDTELARFKKELNASKQLRDAERKLRDIERATKYKDFGKHQREVDKQREVVRLLFNAKEPNTDVAKLRSRIAQNTFFTSYGRNQDTFIEFAARYLAETNYFGKDACFKLYQYYGTQEQNDALLVAKDTLRKKEYDNLPFHQGKLTYFERLSNHLQRYENWDMPFVVQNNAIQLQLRSGLFANHTITLQRAALVYLLEHALYGTQHEPEGKGLLLLTDYFTKQQADQKCGKQQLENNSITSSKHELKQLLPKRLVHHYIAPDANDPKAQSALINILDQAKRAEKRYQDLHYQAQQAGSLDDFKKRNKGLQFKLQFVRKACNIMWFKDTYKQQTTHDNKHHKGYHITRDEFNNFSRFMYAFDKKNSAYKAYLHEMFEQRGFFLNNEFKKLFKSCDSLSELYTKTKKIYEQWLLSDKAMRSREGHHQLSDYNIMFESTQLYINCKHFASYLTDNDFMKCRNKGMLFRALENTKYLIEDFYYGKTIEKDDKGTYKANRKLFNELHTVRLEDSLLYEVAIRYLQHTTEASNTWHFKNIYTHISNAVKKPLNDLLTDDLVFKISKKDRSTIFLLSVPFKKLDSYIEQLSLKADKEGYLNNLFSNVADFIEVMHNAKLGNKELNAIYPRFSANKCLSLDEFNKIENILITSSMLFTRVALSLEEYYIIKNKLAITSDNWIGYEGIIELASYFSYDVRNGAFHFGVPLNASGQVCSYQSILKTVEAEFIAKELRPANPHSYQSLSKAQQAVCNRLLTSLHNDLIERKNKEIDWNTVNETYFNKHIKQR